MNKCSYYQEKEWLQYDITGTVLEVAGKCNDTRERDVCYCGGNPAKCDFYRDIRENACKKKVPKFGEWISTSKQLPLIDEEVLIYHGYGCGMTIAWLDDGSEPRFISEESTYAIDEIEYWTPLPQPPTGDNHTVFNDIKQGLQEAIDYGRGKETNK